VAGANDEITIQGRVHRFGWLVLPIIAGEFLSIAFVLDTSYPITRISTRTHTLLEAFGLITPVSGRTMRIHGLHTEEHALPDIDVRVSQVVSRLGLEAMLGLNFLALFTEVCFQRPSVVLTLRR